MAQKIIMPTLRGERGTFSYSNEKVLLRQIVATHKPDGRGEVDVRPILQIVEDILSSASSPTQDVTKPQEEALEDKSRAEVLATVLEEISNIISRISCEISYKCIDGVEEHSTAISLFNMLSSYSWDVKLVLTLAAFALNYGHFWLLDQLYSTNRLASKMAILKQLPSVTQHLDMLKPRLEAINNLIRSILDLSKCILGFRDLPSKYISQDNQVHSRAIAAIPLATYWIFRSVIACATTITNLSGRPQEHTITTVQEWELSSLIHKITNIDDSLRKDLATCHQVIDERKHGESYEALVDAFEAIHVDKMNSLKSINMKILELLINPAAATELLVVDGSSKTRVSLDILRKKTVLLLISDLNISPEELMILGQVYHEGRSIQSNATQNLYEVVWIPVEVQSTSWREANEQKLDMLKANIPWYYVDRPLLYGGGVIRFIREKFHFKRKSIIVVLDPQGKVVNPNALHMIWIWQNIAFPFTSSREQTLWEQEHWTLDLLVDHIDLLLLQWMKEERYIILYGSDDINWILKFIVTARKVANVASLPLEMVYVGKGTKKERVSRVIARILEENLCYAWRDDFIWFFWSRLESMLFSKIELGSDDKNDLILHEIKKLLSYDKAGSWALLSKGSEVILNGYGTTVLSTIEEYDSWNKDAEKKGFAAAFKDHYEKLHTDHPCCRLEFETSGKTSEMMQCPECSHNMDKFVTFSCCHE